MNEEKDLFDELMEFIDAKFEADETSYSEVIGALVAAKEVYKAQWTAICNEIANDDSDECSCCDGKEEIKLQ